MKRIGLYGMGLLVAALQCSTQLQAADPKSGEREKSSEKSGDALHAVPFQGTVSAVDLGGRTFSLNGKAKERMFKVTEKTEIVQDNKPVTLSAITVGSSVRGSAVKKDEMWEARKVTIGAKETPAPVKK